MASRGGSDQWTLVGFKNFRTIVLNPTRFWMDIAIVTLNTFRVPTAAIREYLHMGVDRMPDAPLSNPYDSTSIISDLPLVPSYTDSSDDED